MQRITVALLGLVVCGQSIALNHHQYHVKLDSVARTLDVTVRLAESGSAVRITSVAGQKSDLLTLNPCPVSMSSQTRSIRSRGSNSFTVTGGCFQYRVQLAPIEGRMPLPWSDAAWMSRPARFMWLPDDELPIKVQMDSGGVPVSLPWQSQADGWWIYPSASSGRSAVVFGGQPLQLGLDQPGVFLSTQPDEVRRLRVERWLSHYLLALDDLLDGYYPTELQVVAIDVQGSGRSPVPFGHVVREQGSSVRFYVDAQSSFDELIADWTAPHELAHLLLPYVKARWISEGFASYYQNVLLARTGEVTAEQAWAKLRERFARAQTEGRRSTPASAESRLLTYWSGAALALRLDLELRAQGSSLDAVLGQLARCCLPARESYSALQFARKLDQLSGSKLAEPLVLRYQHRRGMPATDDLFSPHHELLRQSIMQIKSRPRA